MLIIKSLAFITMPRSNFFTSLNFCIIRNIYFTLSSNVKTLRADSQYIIHNHIISKRYLENIKIVLNNIRHFFLLVFHNIRNPVDGQ